MADHPRKVIRHKVKDILLGGPTSAAARVYPSRILPIRRKETLPLILVDTPNDDVEQDSYDNGPLVLDRTVEVVLAGFVEGVEPEDVADACDALALEIELLMNADPQLSGSAGDTKLQGTTIDVEREGDRVLGMCVLTYEIEYRDDTTVDPATLDDFLSANTNYNLGNAVHPDDDAHDDFEVQSP